MTLCKSHHTQTATPGRRCSPRQPCLWCALGAEGPSRDPPCAPLTRAPSCGRTLSRRVIHGERQKIFNPSLDEEDEAEIHVDAPRLRGLPDTAPHTAPSRRPSSAGLSPISAEALSVDLGARASPSARAVRNGAFPGRLVRRTRACRVPRHSGLA